MTGADRERVLGVEVDVITRDDLEALVVDHVRRGERLWVANHNLHSAYLAQDDEVMRTWYRRADVVFVDGMSLVAASRARGGRLRRAHRATVLDWMPAVLHQAGREGRSVFHLGGEPAWIDRGASAWRAQHPGLEVDVHHGFFDPDRSDEVIERINTAGPDLLLVGLGSPQQERWLARHADRIDVPVIVVVGAFLGFAAGVVPAPPRWVGQIGLEWLWRLATRPRHVARRYLVEPFLLLKALRRSRSSAS